MNERLVAVTGGGKGIGRAIALAFAAAGDRVVVGGRDGEALAATTAQSPRIASGILDVTDEASVEAFFAAWPEVDVLVNNAGIASSAPIEKHALAEWKSLLDVNATGAFLCARAVLPAMKRKARGRIVFVASTAGVAGFRYTAGYTASKHAAIGLMRAIAAEVAGSGITCNAVCPGFVRTEMTERSLDNIVAKTGRSHAEALADILESSRLGRLVEPDEVAHAVAFLASDLAAPINGQALILDGGSV